MRGRVCGGGPAADRRRHMGEGEVGVGRLDGRTAIVTGAAKGIGEGIARVLAREGARVALADVDGEAGRGVEADLCRGGADVFFQETDVSDEGSVNRLVEAAAARFGRLDVLVNNAGIGVYKTILDATPEEWNRTLAVNLTGVYLCSRAAIPHMQRQRRGAVVNVASVHAVQNVAATSPYAASKGGVLALTRTMAIDFARDGIRVNAVCPGWIETPLTRGIFAASGDFEGMRRQVAERQLLGRLGQPEDVGHAVLYLASDEADFVTGTALMVDAGLTAQLETW